MMTSIYKLAKKSGCTIFVHRVEVPHMCETSCSALTSSWSEVVLHTNLHSAPSEKGAQWRWVKTLFVKWPSKEKGSSGDESLGQSWDRSSCNNRLLEWRLM